ncbi:hyperosmotically inducible protein [Paraburkholderia sp. GAS448]
MKAINAIRQASGVLAVVVACSAYGQASDTGRTASAPVVASMAAPPSSKAKRHANHKLENDVRRALAKTKGINPEGIVVLARNGVVTLTGNAPDSEQAARATQVAKGVAGVTSVTNQITIGQPGS